MGYHRNEFEERVNQGGRVPDVTNPYPLSPYENSISYRTLQYIKMVSNLHADTFSNLMSLPVKTREDMIRQQLVHYLEAHVLCEDAGDPLTVKAVASYEVPLKPWWIPGFLWRRLKTETRTVEKSASGTPKWVYPAANVGLQDSGLGLPVRFFEATIRDRSGSCRA